MTSRFRTPAMIFSWVLLAGTSLVLGGCDAEPDTADQTTIAAPATVTVTTSVPPAEAAAEYVSVLHPYHNEFGDAPSYLIPETITVAEGLSLPDFPQSIAAQKITSDPLPDTDLTFAPKPVATGHHFWQGAVDDLSPSDATLGSQDAAAAAARGFLEAHGLGDDGYSEPKVIVGSSQSGPDGAKTTSWLVRFEREEAAPGLKRYVSVRVGDKNEVTQVTLATPRLEALEGKLVSLRPISEVVADPQAWQEGGSGMLQNEIQGAVAVEITGVSLAYEDPGSGDEPIAVPVYRFEVEVRTTDGSAMATGVWTVVAAADVVTTGAAPSAPVTIRDTAIPPEQMPDDFGFVAAYGVLGRNEFDTFAGTFTKDLGLSKDRVTTQLRLSADILSDLYHDLVIIEVQWHVFSDTFAPDPDPENTGTSLLIQPYQTYRLQWSAGDFDARPIEWDDTSRAMAPEAVALRKWFGKLQAVIELSPEWQELPPMTGGYL